MNQGKLITFEGIEGSGKTTQMDRLCGLLENQGCRIQRFREPGGTALGERIRDLLLAPDAEVERLTELLLFQAARRQLVSTRLEPALAEGCVVLLDRFYDATMAYQGYGRGIPLDLIRQMTRVACGKLVPDLTILLDVDPKQGLNRCLLREGREYAGADRIESSGLDFLERVRCGYLELAAQEPDRFVVVRVTENIEKTFLQVVHSLQVRKVLPIDIRKS
ncbi:MAG TPA: dTMP kinase [bacterium]|nr:dTMP kinase [bacterium]